MIQELVGISSQCDGVRCDMAMLLEPDVFSRTWGLETESFWPEAISRVRQAEKDFLFLGEVYWDREWDLQQQGFDVTYDKRLYDRLRHGAADNVRAHLQADLEFQNRSARFLENHDEPRAAVTFEPGQHRAAAIVTYLAPGMRFFHQGQFEGFRHRVSPHLGRGPVEPVDRELADFYALLLKTIGQEVFRRGHWRLARCTEAWPGNPTHDNFLAFSWQYDEQRWLVVVNYSHQQGQCFVRLDWDNLAGRRFQLVDQMSSALYHRDGNELVETGLYLDLPAWGYHVFELKG